MQSPPPTDKKKWPAARLARVTALSLVGLFLAIQLVPYGRDHSNPPLTGEPRWDSPQTEALARRACFACHSNETSWPWYSHVAPISWRVQSHVEEGREHLNFSEFDRPQDDAHEAAEEVREGEMPLWDYRLMHADARLTDQETRDLVRGLQATFGGETEEEEEEEYGALSPQRTGPSPARPRGAITSREG